MAMDTSKTRFSNKMAITNFVTTYKTYSPFAFRHSVAIVCSRHIIGRNSLGKICLIGGAAIAGLDDNGVFYNPANILHKTNDRIYQHLLQMRGFKY